MLDRRKFLGLLVGGVAAGAAVRSFPFRVYSFPTELGIARPDLRGIFASVSGFEWSDERILPVIYVPKEHPAAIEFEKRMREQFALGKIFTISATHAMNPRSR